MLSAVENQFGPGRAYSHPFAGPSNLLQPCPIPTLSNINTATMSAAEFARPHPKPRYQQNGIRNGLSSPRSKYSTEQNLPVNLAVGSSSTISTIKDEPTNLQTKQDVISQSASLYSQRLTYGATGPSVANNYQPIDFNTLYGRAGMYSAPSLYQQHHALANRNQLHHRPTYLNSPLESYPSYLQHNYSQQQQQIVLPPPQSSLPAIPITNSSSSMPSSSPSLLLSSPSATTSSQNGVQQPQINQTKSNSTSSISDRNCLGREKEAKNCKSVGFKVPTGKEGSMKYRILARPYEKDGRRKSPVNDKATIVRSTTNNNTPTNFTKSSLIELGNGELKRVEDMRTEDFALSVEKSPGMKLVDSTVNKIMKGPHNVIITFSYGVNRSAIDIEAPPEHPFFVYGQGWASCSPDTSLQILGLNCQRLRVGDICISLTKCETTLPQTKQQQLSPPLSTIQNQQQQQQLPPHSFYQQHPHYRDDSLAPQNLSRRPQTTPTTATSTTVSSRAAPLNSQMDVLQQHLFYSSQMNDKSQTNFRSDGLSRRAGSSLTNQQINLYVPNGRSVSQLPHITMANSPPHSSSYPSSSRPSSNHGIAVTTPMVVQRALSEETALDASFSKKRRWSAPDICDDENGNLEQPKNLCQ